MTLVLDLPPDLENDLSLDAARMGLPLPEYALRVLSASRMAGSQPRNGAELVAYWQDSGVVGTRPDIQNAPEHARTLRQQSESRERP